MNSSPPSGTKPMGWLAICANVLRTVAEDRTSWAVLGLTLLALGLRLTGISFGLPHRNARPDEEYIVYNALFVLRNRYLDQFDYPGAYIHLVALMQGAYYILGRLSGRFAAPEDFNLEWRMDPTRILLIDRSVSAILGALTVPLLFWLGSRVLGKRQGLLAAGLLSVAYLHVRDSHFGTSDAMLAFMCVLALLAIDWAANGRGGRLFAAAVAVGLAISTKYNAAALLAPLGLTCFAGLKDQAAGPRARLLSIRALGCALGVPAGFLLATPSAPARWSNFKHDVGGLLSDKLGSNLYAGMDAGPGWSRHFSFSLWYGVGWPLLLAALLGLGLLVARRRKAVFAAAVFAAAYWAQMGSSHLVFVRYAVPLVPLVCLFASGAVFEAETWIPPRARRLAFGIGVGALLAVPLGSSLMLDRLLLREDTRLELGRWIESTIPKGASLGLVGSPMCHAPIQASPAQMERLRLSRIESKSGGEGTRRQKEAIEKGSRPSYELFRSDKRPDHWVDFLTGSPAATRTPDYVILPEFPSLAPELVRLAGESWVDGLLQRDYRLVYELRSLRDGPIAGDVQDLFFLPYAGLRFADRPGPSLKVYARENR